MNKNYFETLNWTYCNTCSEAGVTVDEYIDDDHKYLKQVWNDGYTEYHEIG